MNKHIGIALLALALVPFSGCSGCTPAPVVGDDAGVTSGDGDGDGTVGDGDGDGDRDSGTEEPTDGGSSPDSGAVGGDGDGDGDLGCTIYQEVCDGTCTNVTVDPNNCGDCGVTCTGDEACVAGACGTECLGDQVICGNTCVDLDYDNDHCGDCDNACPDGQGCAGGECVDNIVVGPGPDECPASGPIIPITGSGGSVSDGACGGDLAQTTFRWGLCSCADLSTSGRMDIDAYDSLLAPYAPGGLGGGLGVNESISTSSDYNVTGSLWAAGDQGIGTSARIDVGLELKVGGPLTSSGSGSVGLDAFVNGDVTVNDYTVGGDLHVPAGADVQGMTYSMLVEEPIDVPVPCDCGEDQRVPVAGIVDARSTANDNALIGLDPDALVAPGEAVRLELPCGSYYLSAISGADDVAIVAKGRVALYIGGDVSTSAPIAFTLVPGAELDVFIAGTIGSSARITLGSPAYPALMRFYVGSESGIGLSSELDVGAFLYAAEGGVHTSGDVEIFGGIFAGDYTSSGDTVVHFDGAVLSAGESCPPPGGTVVDPPAPDDGGVVDDAGPGDPEPQCETCTDCGNQACVDGQCGACETSSDCCAPLLCIDGTCLLVGG